MLIPSSWPTSPLFRETTTEARKRQKAFYQRAYGHVDPDNYTESVKANIAYIDFMLLPEQKRIAEANQENYSHLLKDLEDL